MVTNVLLLNLVACSVLQEEPLSEPKLRVKSIIQTLHPVIELPGGWGVEPPPPSYLLNPPKQDALGYPGGGQFQPPAVVNDVELPVCNDSDNE
jgi:hypothetical protein